MKIQESAENYLETIFMLSKKQHRVRSIDIANKLEYTKAIVSVAMKNLRESGHIEMDDNGYITLTKKGHKVAKEMYERHTLITKWLISLGVGEDVAADDACRVEHVLSTESFEAMKKHVSSFLNINDEN